MRRNVLRSGILALALLASASVSADSQLSLSGIVSGVELCEQADCGSAIFVAGFAGEIGDRPAVGLAVGGMIHQPLPVAPGCVDLFGGSSPSGPCAGRWRAMSSPAATSVTWMGRSTSSAWG